MPAARAGSTSLSSLSPRYTMCSGDVREDSMTREKNSGEGFDTPHSAEDAMKSASNPDARNSASAPAGWLPAIPTIRPA